VNRRRACGAIIGLALAGPLMACGSDEVPNRAGPTAAAGAPARPTRVPPTPFPAPGKVFLGVQTNLGPWDFSAVDAFSAATHYSPPVLQYSVGWAHDAFDAGRLRAIVDRGMLAIIAWEPWDYTKGPTQSAYRLSAIASGRYDDYLRSWATGVAALRIPIVIRFAHEMNGNWYPWCEQVNGNHPGDYVRAWRHVHEIFTAAGARNVTWMWSPNVTYPGAAPLSALYPGDSYVDWVGLSGYYGTGGVTSYVSFDSIFNNTVAAVGAFTLKPVVIAETSATNATGQQSRWINDMFTSLPSYPNVIGVVWFEATKEIDWRIAHHPASVAAFAAGAAADRYQASWTSNSVPRTG
jgi:mannan endo-1,4-beta-mannosidase